MGKDKLEHRTIQQIAIHLGAKAHQVRYAIRVLGLAPDVQVGRSLLYGPAKVRKIAEKCSS